MAAPEAFSFQVPPELLAYIDRRIEQKLAEIHPAVEAAPVFYSRKEVASIFCISIATLNRYVVRGILKSHKIGSRILFTQEAINKALTEIRK